MSPVRAQRHRVSFPTWNVSGLEGAARRGGLIFHASLHEEKLREARGEASAPPKTVYTG